MQGRCLHSCRALLLPQPLHTTPRRGFVVGILQGRSLQSPWLAGEVRGCIPLDHWDWVHSELPPASPPGCCCGPLWVCLPLATCPCFLPVPRCQPGWFNLQPHNPAGCTSCFCYGHSTACTAADGYEVTHVRSDFSQGTDPPALGETEGTAAPTPAKKLWQFGKAGAEHPVLGLSIPFWG